MKIENISQLEAVIQLMQTYKLDLIEVDNLKILKSKHDFQQPDTKPSNKTEDDLLFWSAKS